MSSQWKVAVTVLTALSIIAFVAGAVRGRGLSTESVRNEQLLSAISFGILWLAYQSGVIASAIISFIGSEP